MISHKRIRTKGKLGLSRVFKNLQIGDRVAIIMDLAHHVTFPKRIHGKTGNVKGYRGKAVIVDLKDGKKQKEFIISKVHLKKLK